MCGADPSCVVAVYSGKICYVRYTMGKKQKGDGVACVKKKPEMILDFGSSRSHHR